MSGINKNQSMPDQIPSTIPVSDFPPILSRHDIDEFWSEGLRQGKRLGLKVASDSMRPLMTTGDRIFVEPFPSGRQPLIGEIVLLRTHDGWLVHRIVGTSGSGDSASFLQKGDAGHHAQAVPVSAVMGRVTAIETRDGTIQLNSRFQSGVRMIAGRSFQLVEWFMNRGADFGRDKESGAASPVRVTVSRLVRMLERGIAWLVSWLARRGAS